MGVGQPASMYWNMCLGVASTANDAQVQSGILLSVLTRNLVVVGRRPFPGPNSASYVLYGFTHRLAVVPPRAA